jgi:hypothetical protein
MRLVQKVSMLFGIVFICVGIVGFFYTGMSMDSEMATAPRILGVFPVNAAHNAVHILFGIWGVAAARDLVNARRYCQLSGALYLVLAALGFLLPTTFGFIPIGGNDIALHAVLGLALTLVGFMATDDAPSPTRV